MSDKAKSGTFELNKKEPIHGWYSYIEGYSSCLVQNELSTILNDGANIENVYDPFGGTGTTPLVASQRGMHAFFSESNPFMSFVTKTKINGTMVVNTKEKLANLREYVTKVENLPFAEYSQWDGFERFFGQDQLNDVLSIKCLIEEESDVIQQDILMLALSSILVRVSKMVRRGDLRYATEKEYKAENVKKLFVDKLTEIIDDVESYGQDILQPVVLVSEDARDNKYRDLFECVITSPPYLNGTNYIRNTKLELKLNGFITSEKDLPAFHSKGIIAGINNVSKRSGERPVLPDISLLMEQLKENAYDERIPKMVSGYFYDMNDVIDRLHNSMCNGAYFIMDIGDSQFGGVHIPTHEVLSHICENHGFVKYSEEVLRKRKSKNGMILTQRILRYRLEK